MIIYAYTNYELHIFLQSPEERFDYAKQLKQVVDELQKVSTCVLYHVCTTDLLATLA